MDPGKLGRDPRGDWVETLGSAGWLVHRTSGTEMNFSFQPAFLQDFLMQK